MNSRHTSVAAFSNAGVSCSYCCAAVEKEFNWRSTPHNPSTTVELFVVFVIDISFIEFKITSPKRCSGVTWNDFEILSSSVALICVFVFLLPYSSLWLFVSKFTDLTPNRLHKVYKHMAKKRSEQQQELNKVLLSCGTSVFLSVGSWDNLPLNA